MTRPHGILRAGFPYLTTLGMRRVTNFPTDIAFGEGTTVYILMRSEGAATIRIWSTDDMEELTDDLKGFGSYGSEDGQFIWPVSMINGLEDDLYISDEWTNRITRLSSEGEFISKFGKEGDEEGAFRGPAGIALDQEGNMVVVDSKNHRIQRYSISGEYMDGFGTFGTEEGCLNLPWGIDVDEFGDIYVADWGNNRVQVFTSEGHLKHSFGELGSGEGQFERPTGVSVDTHGDVYVADWGNNRVMQFNPEGQYLWSFTGDATLSKVARNYMLTNAVPNRLRETGRLEHERYLRRPRSVRIDSEFRLFIPDYESYRIQVYQKDFLELDETQYAAPLRNPTLEVT